MSFFTVVAVVHYSAIAAKQYYTTSKALLYP